MPTTNTISSLHSCCWTLHPRYITCQPGFVKALTLYLCTLSEGCNAKTSSRSCPLSYSKFQDGLLSMLQVTERLTRLVRHKQGGIIVVEGEPGMGKTRLLEELEHESMDQRQSLDTAVPGELPAIRKMCNIFVANGDHANKSKVCQALCLMGRACHCIIMPSCIQATSRHHCDRSSRPDHSSKVKSCKLTGLAVASVINVQSLPVR